MSDKIEIYPLQIGKIDWRQYVDVCQSFLGESPTRGIDAAGIDLENPIAFLKTLDFGNKPVNAIAQEHLYNHIFFSFILITNLPTIAQISERSSVSLAFVEKRSKALCLLSGTLKQWKESLVCSCHKLAETEVREVANELYLKFEAAGFGEIWTEYRHTPERDGTFSLTRKRG